MKGAIAVCCRGEDLLASLSEAALSLGFRVTNGEDSVQVADGEGRLLTMFVGAEPDWEWRRSDLRPGVGDLVPAFSMADGFAVECRWEDLFCALIVAVAERVPWLWVVDGDGVAWPASQLDARRVRL